jgi:hypothetical protein
MSSTTRHDTPGSSLERISARFAELVAEAKTSPQPLSAETLDDIAATAGELMLALVSLKGSHPSELIIRQAISDAQRVRAAARGQSHGIGSLDATADELSREVEVILRSGTRAA